MHPFVLSSQNPRYKRVFFGRGGRGLTDAAHSWALADPNCKFGGYAIHLFSMSMTNVSLQTLFISVTITMLVLLRESISFAWVRMSTWQIHYLHPSSDAPTVQQSEQTNILMVHIFLMDLEYITFIREENLDKCNSKHNTQDRLIKTQEVLFIIGIWDHDVVMHIQNLIPVAFCPKTFWYFSIKLQVYSHPN